MKTQYYRTWLLMSAVHVSCTGSVKLLAEATRSATYLVFMLNKQLLANADNFVFFQRRVKRLAWQTREGQTVTGKTDSGAEHERLHHRFQTIRRPEWCQQKFGLFKWKCSGHHLTKYTDIYSYILLLLVRVFFVAQSNCPEGQMSRRNCKKPKGKNNNLSSHH